jgi:hypothetical protein
MNTLDIESLSRHEYVSQSLEEENLGYINKNTFINDYTQETMNIFIGTKAQCDAKYDSCKNSAELLYKERAKKINNRTGELREEWFNHHTKELSSIEKQFVLRCINILGMETKEAIDRVEEFTDLLDKKIK